MKRKKLLGHILFWCTLISPMVAFCITDVVGEVKIFGIPGFNRYSWIMWLFIPIGILSIFVGVMLKKSNLPYRKNIVIACICLPLLLIFGSYRFIFTDFSYDPAVVPIIEEKVDLTLPDNIKVATDDMGSYRVIYLKINDSENNRTFAQELECNTVWKDTLSSKMGKLLPFDSGLVDTEFDYFVFYNQTTNEYNQYPPDGKSTFTFIAYDFDLQRIIIVDDFIVDLY